MEYTKHRSLRYRPQSLIKKNKRYEAARHVRNKYALHVYRFGMPSLFSCFVYNVITILTN